MGFNSYYSCDYCGKKLEREDKYKYSIDVKNGRQEVFDKKKCFVKRVKYLIAMDK